MRITSILINGDVHHLGGSVNRLAQDLQQFSECGYDGVEISSDGLDAVLAGQLHTAQVERIRAVTERYDLVYTVHPPGRLNLALPQPGPDGRPDIDMEKAVFAANLAFCRALGAGVMVYHSGLIGLHDAALGHGRLPSAEEMEQARRREVEALRELMPLAAELGVTVGMENRDPHPWEVAVLARAGLPASDLLTYHAGLAIPNLVRQVAEVDHPNLGLTLDVGHLFLSSKQCGWDYLDVVHEAAPHVRHLHFHDNFGRLGSVFGELEACLPYGERDLHLPPGWGAIPLLETLQALPQYEGMLVLEMQPRLSDHFAEALHTARELVARASQSREG